MHGQAFEHTASAKSICRRFQPGPIYTGKIPSFCLNCVAVTYVLFMTGIFIMPTSYPTSSTTLNWYATCL